MIMTTKTITTYIAISLSHIEVPASVDGVHAAGRHVVGIGLFIARRDRANRWRFRRHAYALGAGEPEEALLEWVADLLPGEATLIGWQVDHSLIPLLLDAARGSCAEVAHHFIGRLFRLLGGGAVDMSLGRGGAAAPPLADVAEEMAIYAPRRDPVRTFSAWATGKVSGHRQDVEDEALSIWRVFVRVAGPTGADAEAATDSWIRQSGQLCLVARAGSAA